MKNEQIKALIEISRNTDEANVVIERYLSLKTVEEKIAYLQANFDVEIIKKYNKHLCVRINW